MYCNNGQQKIENTAFNLGFLCVCSRREDFVRLLRSSVFFSALRLTVNLFYAAQIFVLIKAMPVSRTARQPLLPVPP
jgi:hypothetical protein